MARRDTPEWKEKHSRSVSEAWGKDGHREKKSAATKAMWEDPVYREKHRVIWSDPERLARRSEAIRSLWEKETYSRNQALSRSAVFRAGFRSSLESVVSSLLPGLGISFREQEPVGPFVFDFFLPDCSVLIECQGEYWHGLDEAGLDEAKSRDAAKFTYVSRFFPDYRVLYLHERDFLNPLSVREKIVSFLSGPVNQVSRDFDFSDVFVLPLPTSSKVGKSRWSAPELFLNCHHYGQYGRASKIVYGALLGEELIAVAKFSGVVRKEVATSVGMTSSEVLELDRFCIHPLFHKRNFASWFLSRACKAVFASFPKISALVSFSDRTYGHVGTVYRSLGWAVSSVVPPDYHYVDSTGWVMHKKTLFDHAKKLRKKEIEYAAEYGYRKVYGKEKTKFILMRPV